jgi:DNA-binding transcriptional MerR regulator/methylmalonyl-CoA mutase cobalamin-binding subunit
VKSFDMSIASDNLETGAKNLYTIGTVSKLTGVAPITLRAWERRYELIEPVRKASGHRLYTREHIDRINRITDLQSQGVRLSQIRPEMLESEVTGSPEGPSPETAWARYIEGMITAVIAFDESRLEEVYGEALSLYPIEEVTTRLLKPLLVELGLRWESKRGSVAEEHFFAYYLRNKLGARYHHRSRRNKGPRLLIAGLPGEYHEIALLIFALAAQEHGFRLLTLGASMPLDELPAVVKKAKCDAIVLSGSIEPKNSLLTRDLPLLIEHTDVPVLVGGQSSVYSCEAISRAGAEALGQDVEHGLKRLGELLGYSGNERLG